MKKPFLPAAYTRRHTRILCCRIGTAALLALGTYAAYAASKTWDGGGADANWLTGGNWDFDAAPVAADSLFFDGAVQTTANNNFAADTGFSGITFSPGASAFTLTGNRITLNGNITNNSAVMQTINLPINLNVLGRTIDTGAAGMTISAPLVA